MSQGAQIYADECAGCHKSNGEGAANLFPALNGSATVQQIDPTSLLRVVLRGARSVATAPRAHGAGHATVRLGAQRRSSGGGSDLYS